MRYTINLHQPKILEWDLNLTQAFLFCFLYELPSWANSVTINGVVYYQAATSKIIEELPVLTDKPDTIKRLKKALADKDLIISKFIDGKQYIALTDKAREWNTYKSVDDFDNGGGEKIPPVGEKNPSKQGKKSDILNNHDKLTIDKKHKKSSSPIVASARNEFFASCAGAPSFAFSDYEEKESLDESNLEYHEEESELTKNTRSKKITDIAENLLDDFNDFVLDTEKEISSENKDFLKDDKQTYSNDKKTQETRSNSQANNRTAATAQTLRAKTSEAEQQRLGILTQCQKNAICELVSLCSDHISDKRETYKSIVHEWKNTACFRQVKRFDHFMNAILNQLVSKSYKIHKSVRVSHDLEEKSKAEKEERKKTCFAALSAIQEKTFYKADTTPKPIHSENAKNHFSILKDKFKSLNCATIKQIVS